MTVVELTKEQEVLEELGAPQLLSDIAAGGHWNSDRIQDAADWCNLAKMAAVGFVTCADVSEPSAWFVTPKGRRALADWKRR